MRDSIISKLKTVYDPEIPINIYDLGLVYGIQIGDGDKPRIDITMTMTSPTCPVSVLIVANVKRVLASLGDVYVSLVWEPAWNPTMISEYARLALDIPASVLEQWFEQSKVRTTGAVSAEITRKP